MIMKKKSSLQLLNHEDIISCCAHYFPSLVCSLWCLVEED